MELETADPMKALKAKSIHERCAAARDLSLVGDLDALPALSTAAARDKSPAVRLCTAGAAADILSRYRVGAARKGLEDDARLQILDLFKVIDPSHNAGLFPMLACLDVPASFRRIASGLRDPRGDVRVGAGVGLLRLCTSIAHQGDAELEANVVALLTDKRLKPDAIAEAAKVCVAAGYESARPVLRGLDLGETAQAEMLAELIEKVGEMEAPPAGLWWSNGFDAGEVGPEAPLPPALRVCDADGSAQVYAAGGPWAAAKTRGPTRRMWFRRVGQPAPGHALQAGGRTWYQVQPADVGPLLDQALGVENLDWSAGAALPGATALADALLPTLGDAAADDRLRGLLLQRAGRPAEALEALESALTKKKLPGDTWFFVGEARHAAGDPTGARAAWAATEKKAKRKKDWQVARAKARLDG